MGHVTYFFLSECHTSSHVVYNFVVMRWSIAELQDGSEQINFFIRMANTVTLLLNFMSKIDLLKIYKSIA